MVVSYSNTGSRVSSTSITRSRISVSPRPSIDRNVQYFSGLTVRGRSLGVDTRILQSLFGAPNVLREPNTKGSMMHLVVIAIVNLGETEEKLFELLGNALLGLLGEDSHHRGEPQRHLDDILPLCPFNVRWLRRVHCCSTWRWHL